ANRAASNVADISCVICSSGLLGMRSAGMHTSEMGADACTDSVRIAERYRVTASVELSRRCYLVIAIVAPVSAAVALRQSGGVRVVRVGGLHRARHQSGTRLAHRQTVLGVLQNRRVLGGRRGRPAMIPHRLPVQVGAVGEVSGIEQPFGE